MYNFRSPVPPPYMNTPNPQQFMYSNQRPQPNLHLAPPVFHPPPVGNVYLPVPPPHHQCTARPMTRPMPPFHPPPTPMPPVRIPPPPQRPAHPPPPHRPAHPPPPPVPTVDKDDLALRQEEFIRRCMYPSRKFDLIRTRRNSPERYPEKDNDIFPPGCSKSPVRNQPRNRSKSPGRRRDDSRDRGRRDGTPDRLETNFTSDRNRSRSPTRNQILRTFGSPQNSNFERHDEIKRISPLLRRFNTPAL